MPFLPKDAADSCLRRAHNFLDLARSKPSTPKVKNDLLRMALVMAVAALDSYMHGIITKRIAAVRRRADLPKALARLEMPFSEFANLADASINAQRAGRKARPWVALFLIALAASAAGKRTLTGEARSDFQPDRLSRSRKGEA